MTVDDLTSVEVPPGYYLVLSTERTLTVPEWNDVVRCVPDGLRDRVLVLDGGMTAQTFIKPGRCAETTEYYVGASRPWLDCVLTHGHEGQHEASSGAHWTPREQSRD